LNTRERGTEYENIAAEYLTGKGYEILERNYRNPCGELDIIAEKDGVIVYVEIKYRSSARYGDPLEAVDARKQRQISKVAARHYARYGARERKACRFDVIGIYGDGTIRHIENAFNFIGNSFL
jgi:putative endonuclease